MYMTRLILLIVIVAGMQVSYGQVTYDIRIVDAESGKPIFGAQIIEMEQSNFAMSNMQGFFKIKGFPSDELRISVGQYKNIFIILPVDTVFQIALEKEEIDLSSSWNNIDYTTSDYLSSSIQISHDTIRTRTYVFLRHIRKKKYLMLESPNPMLRNSLSMKLFYDTLSIELELADINRDKFTRFPVTSPNRNSITLAERENKELYTYVFILNKSQITQLKNQRITRLYLNHGFSIYDSSFELDENTGLKLGKLFNLRKK